MTERVDELLQELAARKDLDHRDQQAIVRAALDLWPEMPLHTMSMIEVLGIPTRSSVLAAWTRKHIEQDEDKILAVIGPAAVWGMLIGGTIDRIYNSGEGIVRELEAGALIFVFWVLAIKPTIWLRHFLLRRGVARMSFERAFALASAPLKKIVDAGNEKERSLQLFTVRDHCKHILAR
jgi:hypothetical protein